MKTAFTRGSRRSSRLAFTLLEMTVSLSIIAGTGGIIFGAIHTVALLGVKTTAVNVTHQQSRDVIHKAVQQIHASVSVPSMADTSLASVAGSGPAAGVTFQTLYCGPDKVFSSALAGQKVVVITRRASDPLPTVGMRLIVPAFRIEDTITAVVNGGTTCTLTLTNNLSSAITCLAGTPNYVAYVTQRAGMVVVNGDLRNYPNIASGSFNVVARGLSTATPFSVPAGDTRYVQASFDILDPKVTGLNLKSMNTRMSLTVPYRYRLTTFQ